MTRFDRQFSAAARQYESACDCCDADPRAIAAEAAEARAEIDLVPHANAATEWAGITRRDDAVSESLAEVRRLNRLHAHNAKEES